MKILLLSDRHHKYGSVSISPWLLFGMILLAVTGASMTSSWLGYNLGHEQGVEQGEQSFHISSVSGSTLQSSIEQQRKEWEQNKKLTREHLNVLALKLGELQSHIVRLNALGERLTKMGKFDADEFDFKKIPARGGADSQGVDKFVEMSELVDEIETLSRVIEDREIKLNVMEELIMNSELQKEVYPSGRPVKGGWVSSPYGERLDPFTGSKTFHDGVDIAGKLGTKVVAVGSGIVTFSGTKSGYGKVVKIHHGKGFVTLYAHNNELMAQVGDYVTKGQQIATVGSTGRSTGPHLHFEVHLKGKTVNPQTYLQASR
jgi:murein DD-endopeptidase MepM/ murein hydrolase activator NlpD